MTKRFLLSAILLALCVNASAQQLFDGGMMVHSGFLHTNIQTLNYDAKGATFGIGGVLRFHIGNHIRVGGEGYVSTLNQMGNGSYIRTGWGGMVVDSYWQLRRWMPYAGLCIGGGNASTLLVFNGDDSDWGAEPVAVLHNGTFMFLNPYIGIEYALTDAVHLTLKADRLSPINSKDIPVGPRLYLGFIFAH